MKPSIAVLFASAILMQPAFADKAASAAKPTDPEIAHIVVTANTIDIEAGNLAKEKSKNQEVTAFAEQMVTDHTAVNQQATELATKLGVTPKENATSKSLSEGAKKNIKHLQAEKGKNFDLDYVKHEVAYHKDVLKAIDQTLIPSAQNAELKALIEKVRPAIAAHLEHAEALLAKLKGSKK